MCEGIDTGNMNQDAETKEATVAIKSGTSDAKEGSSSVAKEPNEEIADNVERENLLNNEPVHVEPSWEAHHVEYQPKAPEPPADRLYLVYFIMVLNGIGVLMPWNMFITANSYFVDYKLSPAVNPNATFVNESCHGPQTETEAHEYQKNFISYLGIASQLPNVALNMVNICAQCDLGNISRRIIGSILIMIAVFVVTVVLAMVDTSAWPFYFFIITMISVVVINMATGVYQNSVFGLAASLPMKYTNAVVLGSNISGTLTSIIAIVSLASSPNPRTAAIYYFLSAILILLIDFDTYFMLPLLRFYRFYQKQSQEVAKKKAETQSPQCCPAGKLLSVVRQCAVHFLNVWLTFFVTLTCFPAIQVNIPKTDGSFFTPEKYFIPVACFLIFNSFAVLGNLLTEVVKKPGPKYLFIPVVLRILFIPLFMICNYNPKYRSFPVFIFNNYIYMTISILHALSHGYCSSLSMMYAPREAKEGDAGTAAMVAAFFLVLGIFCGVNFSLFIAWFTESIGHWIQSDYAMNLNVTLIVNETLSDCN
ncbi:equilibrative nucleoside transporter 1-like isoform X1 [Lineus longissimus]|uniref:equilibrative nucleoside transporter 1-like isoform X1 n=1 Tax=Lineus longissimus TaxID=88925 RepID=UPI00315C7084